MISQDINDLHELITMLYYVLVLLCNHASILLSNTIALHLGYACYQANSQ